MSGSVKSETVHLIFVLHFAPSLLIFSQYCLCKKSCLPSDKGCRQIPWLGGKLIKWSGINQSLVLVFPSKLPPSASHTIRAQNRRNLWSTLASDHPVASSGIWPSSGIHNPHNKSSLKFNIICEKYDLPLETRLFYPFFRILGEKKGENRVPRLPLFSNLVCRRWFQIQVDIL